MIKILGLFIFMILMISISISIITWNKWHNAFLTTFVTIVLGLMLLSKIIDNL